MSEKIGALAKRIASLDKNLKVIRTKWNLGIIALYSVISFFVLRICDADSLTSILQEFSGQGLVEGIAQILQKSVNLCTPHLQTPKKQYALWQG